MYVGMYVDMHVGMYVCLGICDIYKYVCVCLCGARVGVEGRFAATQFYNIQCAQAFPTL